MPCGGLPSAAIRPGASVFSAATAPPRSNVSVFAAPMARAASLARSAMVRTARLCGIVAFAPAKPHAPSARTVSLSSSGGTGRRW